MELDPKYGLGVKLMAAGAAICLAAYFGMDVTNYVLGFLSSLTSSVPAAVTAPASLIYVY